MITIREYAKKHHVSYEAIRSQVSRYREDLEGHVITNGRTKYLDDIAVSYLDGKRRNDPVSVVTVERSEIVDALREQIDALRNELMITQKRVIELQSENQRMIATETKYNLLLESSNEKTATIETLREDLKDARREREAAQAQADRAREDLKSVHDETDRIRKERDEAQADARSYRKSVFGFYRKIRK